MPAFVVFHDTTLEEIARRRPRELWELAKVSGVGPTKLERYGAELLQALSRHVAVGDDEDAGALRKRRHDLAGQA